MSEAVKDMISQALDQDFNNANKTFGDVMTIKLTDLLDQEQVRLADNIYNGVEPDDENQEDIMGDEDGDQLELDLDPEDGDETEEDEEEISDEEMDIAIDEIEDELDFEYELEDEEEE
jgi:hypothetical protein